MPLQKRSQIFRLQPERGGIVIGMHADPPRFHAVLIEKENRMVFSVIQQSERCDAAG